MRLPTLSAAFAALAVLTGSAGYAPAQDRAADRTAEPPARPAPPARRPPLRVQVTPAPDIYRHCIGGYAVEHRATGDTIVPRLHCWWARGR